MRSLILFQFVYQLNTKKLTRFSWKLRSHLLILTRADPLYVCAYVDHDHSNQVVKEQSKIKNTKCHKFQLSPQNAFCIGAVSSGLYFEAVTRASGSRRWRRLLLLAAFLLRSCYNPTVSLSASRRLHVRTGE